MREVYSTQLAIVVGVLVVMMVAVFALIQSPEALSAPERTAVSMPHPVEGYEQCDACHGIKGARPYPVKHLGWSNASCTKCHAAARAASSVTEPGEGTGRIPRNPHPPTGWDNCLACHAVDSPVKPAPADHKSRPNDSCRGCHLTAFRRNGT